MTKLALAAGAERLAHRFGEGGDGLVLVVHDELVAEVLAGAGEEAAALVQEGMLEAAGVVLGDVPAVVDVAARSRWADPSPPLEALGARGRTGSAEVTEE
jgi:hypothetical protein